MGFNLKEKWQNANKKNVAIISAILILIILLISGGVWTYQYFTLKAFQEEQAERMESYNAMPMNLNGEPKKPSEYNVGIEYDKAVKQKKPILTLFYADWCHYCIKFMPLYQQIAEKYGEDMNFAKVNVEDKKYEKLIQEIGLTGYPTVFIIDPKYDNRVLLSNAHFGSVEHLNKELDRFLRIRKLLDSKK